MGIFADVFMRIVGGEVQLAPGIRVAPLTALGPVPAVRPPGAKERCREVVADPLVRTDLAVALLGRRPLGVQSEVGGVAAKVMSELVVDRGRIVGGRP